MSLKKASVAAMLAVSMASTPVLAQSAALRFRSPRAAARPPSDASELRGGFIIPVVAVVAIILGILARPAAAATVRTAPDRPRDEIE